MAMWIAHRGESADAPENTVAAYRLAAARNVDGIECDIHLTADKVVVCSHDATTTRRCGVEMKIAQSTFAELRKLDAGCGEKIPRFSELLQVVNPGQLLYVEIKISDPEIIPLMMAEVDASGVSREQIVVISFLKATIENYKKMFPEQPALLLMGLWKHDDGTFNPAMDLAFEADDRTDPIVDVAWEKVHECGADGIDVRGYPACIDETFVRRFHDAGMPVAVWTIDDAPTAEYFIKLGVDAITSNCAAKIRDELK